MNEAYKKLIVLLSEMMAGEESPGSAAYKQKMTGGSLATKNRMARYRQLDRRSGKLQTHKVRPGMQMAHTDPTPGPSLQETEKKGSLHHDPLGLDFFKGQKPAKAEKKVTVAQAHKIARERAEAGTDPEVKKHKPKKVNEAYVRLIDIIVEASKSQKRALKAVAQSTKHADYHDEKKWRRSSLGSELLNPKKARLPWKKRREIALAKRDADDAIKKKRAKAAKKRPAETDQEKDERIEAAGRAAMRVR